jgi:hypothetical protein
MVDSERSARELVQILTGGNQGGVSSWEAVVALAQRSSMAPLLFWRLAEQTKEEGGRQQATQVRYEVPPEAYQWLEAAYYRAVAQAVLLDSELSHVLAELDAGGVPAVLLKGAALARSIYPDPALRQMADVDVLVPVRCRAAVKERLSAMGYRHESGEKPGYRPRRFVERYGEAWIFAGPLYVEVHHKLIGGEWVRRVSCMEQVADEIMDRAIPLRTEPRARQLAPADTLVHLAVHMAVNHAFSDVVLRGLLDIALLIESESIDWRDVVERAKRWRVATACYAALDSASRLVDADIPSTVLDELRPGFGRVLLLRAMLDMRSVVEHGRYFVGLRRFLLQLILVDRLEDACCLLWHTFFPESEWLVLRYGLETAPRQRVWLHRVWHPLRVVLQGQV